MLAKMASMAKVVKVLKVLNESWEAQQLPDTCRK